MSVPPPGGEGISIRIGLFGYCCAGAGAATIASTATVKARPIAVITAVPPWLAQPLFSHLARAGPVALNCRMAEHTQTQHPKLASALREFLQQETERILGACTLCGKCVEVCPMTRYSPPMAGVDPKTVVTGIHALMRGETGEAAALGWTSVCVRSASCVPACPESVNPMMMVRIARMQAAGGLGGPKQITLREDRDLYDRVRAYAKLQLTDEEIRNWM
jgi:ferredoxin